MSVPWANPENPMPWHYWGWPLLPGQEQWNLADLMIPTILALLLCALTGFGIYGMSWAVYGLRLVLLARKRRVSYSRFEPLSCVAVMAESVCRDDFSISTPVRNR